VNLSYRLAPFADVLYASDVAFWDSVGGAPEFAGERWGCDRNACARHPVSFIKFRHRHDHFIFDGNEIGDFGNSGTQCANLAIARGAAKVVLIGFDMTAANGIHWHGRHANKLNNPHEINLAKWRNRLNAEAPALQRAGIQVYRESERSTLIAYPVLSIGDAIAQWL